MNRIIYINKNGQVEHEERVPFVLFDNGEKSNDDVYSDRLYQWDSEKYDKLCKKHFGNSGQYWSGREPHLIEAFLRDYTGIPGLVLCKILEYENQSSGYPCWRFDYRK